MASPPPSPSVPHHHVMKPANNSDRHLLHGLVELLAQGLFANAHDPGDVRQLHPDVEAQACKHVNALGCSGKGGAC